MRELAGIGAIACVFSLCSCAGDVDAPTVGRHFAMHRREFETLVATARLAPQCRSFGPECGDGLGGTVEVEDSARARTKTGMSSAGVWRYSWIQDEQLTMLIEPSVVPHPLSHALGVVFVASGGEPVSNEADRNSTNPSLRHVRIEEHWFEVYYKRR